MITGDHPHTAFAVARELGIASRPGEVLSSPELEALSDEALERRVAQVSVYARVSAAHKLRIVRAWQGVGAVVAMTGDGVNDAPAIRGADIGIAMGGTGTEVTKQASGMIVTDDDFASIVAAVEEGRGVFDNIRKTIQYLLAGNSAELLLMAACIALGYPAPLLPIHLLWINLVTDGLPALCLATDPIDTDVMKRPPRPRGESLADRRTLLEVVATGSLSASV
jgi:Ca2+-transporting ATPase